MRFFNKLSLSSTTLIFLVSAYFTLALNWGFYCKVLDTQPFQFRAEDYFILTIPFVYFFCN